VGYGGVLKIARRICEVGVAGWSVTGRRRGGVLNITAAPGLRASTGGALRGNITRTQNVSEYMLVLALCLVVYFSVISSGFSFLFFQYTSQEMGWEEPLRNDLFCVASSQAIGQLIVT